MIRTLRKTLFHNFKFKVVALILACFTWYFVQGEEVLEVNRRLTVSINIPDGLMLKNGFQRTKYVTLRGPRAVMGSAVASGNISAEINLPNASKGKIRYQLTRANLKGDWDRRVSVRIIDPLLDLEIDERFERTLEVKEILQGTPASGFSVEKVTVVPAYIKVSGIKSVIAKLDNIVTESKDITGVSENRVLDAKIIPPPGVSLENISTNSVQIRLQVGESRENKKFIGIPIEVHGTAFQSQTKPSSVDIEIQGSAGAIEFIKANELSAFVDARDLQPGKHNKKIQVKIPNDTVLIETNPENVVLDIRPQKK